MVLLIMVGEDGDGEVLRQNLNVGEKLMGVDETTSEAFLNLEDNINVLDNALHPLPIVENEVRDALIDMLNAHEDQFPLATHEMIILLIVEYRGKFIYKSMGS